MCKESNCGAGEQEILDKIYKRLEALEVVHTRYRGEKGRDGAPAKVCMGKATTHYKVCDAVDNDLSAIHNATELLCNLIFLHLRTPLQDSVVTVSVLRSKLPHVKFVGFSSL